MLRHHRTNEIAANPTSTHLRGSEYSPLFVVLAYLLSGQFHDTEIWAGEYGSWANQEKLCQESRS